MSTLTAAARRPPRTGTPPPCAARSPSLAGCSRFLLVARAVNAARPRRRAARPSSVTSYPGVRALEIEDASDVRLTSAPAGRRLQVVAQVTEGLRTPERDVERARRHAAALSSSLRLPVRRPLRRRLRDPVPAGTSCDADATAGDVRAENLRSTVPVVLESSAGDVTAIDVTAPC